MPRSPRPRWGCDNSSALKEKKFDYILFLIGSSESDRATPARVLVNPQQPNTGIPTLQMRTQRPREVKNLPEVSQPFADIREVCALCVVGPSQGS